MAGSALDSEILREIFGRKNFYLELVGDCGRNSLSVVTNGTDWRKLE
jgi:hypothetical protein